ncbi:MAG: adenylate/guanylate cyclase domain-containing protein [Stellaceae bacterium]
MSPQALRIQAEALYQDEATVIAEAERLLGTSFDGCDTKICYRELLQSYRDLFEQHKRVLHRSDQASSRMRQEQDRSKSLLIELKGRIRELDGLTNIIETVNSSLELEHVLGVIVEHSVALCGADAGSIYVRDAAGRYELRGSCNTSAELVETLRSAGELLGNTNAIRQAETSRHRVEITDLASEPSSVWRRGLLAEGFRSLLIVPLLRGDKILGALVLRCKRPEPLQERSLELLETFARQSASAIFNAEIADERERLNSALTRQVHEQERSVDRLKRFFSPAVAERILREVDGKTNASKPHRAYITVVFCDLRGWTNFTLRTEPEDVMLVLEEYHREIGTLVFRYNGTLERFTGDGLMVFFNDPVEIAQPALQAVRMAVEMRARALQLVAIWHQREHELGFGIGIDQGYASAGTIGFEGRYDYAAIGAVANRAARLCAAAKHGQILISQKVLGDTSSEIEVESVGKLKLKGCGPTSAFNVTNLRDQGSGVPSTDRTG